MCLYVIGYWFGGKFVILISLPIIGVLKNKKKSSVRRLSNCAFIFAKFEYVNVQSLEFCCVESFQEDYFVKQIFS